MRFFQLALVALCAVVLLVLYFREWRQRAKIAPGSFRDWVKNPQYRREVGKLLDAKTSMTVPDDVSDEEIGTMVDRLFIPEDAHLTTHLLKQVPAKATPRLLTTLDEERTYSTTFPFEYRFLQPLSPFECICDVLVSIAPPEAAAPLQRYAQHRNAHFREHAALVLGAIGTGDCVDPVLTLLADEEALVRMRAITGVELALDHGRAAQPLRDAAFSPTLALIRESKSLEIVQPCRLLLSLDRERALAILLSDAYFSNANPYLFDVLRAFNEEKIPIPHDRLLPLIEELELRPKQGKHDLALAEALSACAVNPAGDTEERLRRHLHSPDERVASAAAEGLAALAGVTDPWKHVLQQLDEEHSNVEELTVPQQHYFGVLTYDSEVNNGGHWQYFGNSSGEYWDIALEGLEAVGSPQRAEILREAVALFGKKGPSSDWARRGKQLAGFSSPKDRQLKGCDDRYFACSDNVSVLLALYALEHREHFCTAPVSR